MTIQIMANLSSKNNWELEQHLLYLVTLSFKMKVKERYISDKQKSDLWPADKTDLKKAGEEEGKMAIQQSQNK